ncbi:MAG: hypothetical protein ACI37S_08860 [Candidatus Gastranaerophilaceae bacterium]
MNLFDNKNLIEITQDDINDAALSAKKVDSENQKRAIANVLGARLGIKFLKSIDIKADNFDSLYTIPAVLKNTDIADICVDNIRIDVRIVSDENHLFVPKCQFKYNITPDIYIFMKLAPDSSYGEFIGAIPPDEINKSIENNDFYFISKDSLYNETSLKSALSKSKPKSNVPIDKLDVLKGESLLVNFIDGDLSDKQKEEVFQILKVSKEFRDMFQDFQQFEIISTTLSTTDEVLNDSVLDIVGAQKLYQEELTEEDLENTNLDEIAANTTASFVEDFIDEDNEGINIMDNQNIIDGEFIELDEDTSNEPIEEPGQLEPLPTDEELASFANFEQIEESSENIDDGLDLVEPTNFEGFEGYEGLNATNIVEEAANNLDISLNGQNEIAIEQDTNELSINNEFVQEETLNIKESEDNNFQLEELNPQDIDFNNNEQSGIADLQQVDSSEQNFENFESIEDEQTTNFSEQNDRDIDNSFKNITQSSDTNINDEDSFVLEDLSPNDINFDNIEAEPIEEIQTENIELQNANESANTLDYEMISNEQKELDEFTEPTVENNTDLELEDLSQSDTINDNVGPEINMDLPVLEDFSKGLTNEGLLSLDDYDSTQNTEEIINDETESANDINYQESINFDDFVSDSQIQESENQIQEETLEPVTETSTENQSQNSDDDDDFSGLEEFTMDMATAVEEANPNIHNSQIPEDEREAYNSNFAGFNDVQETTFQNIKGNDVEELINENIEESQTISTSSNIDLESINLDEIDDLNEQGKISNSSNDDSLKFTSDSIPFEQQENNNFNPDNLDTLDIDSEIENLSNSNIDINSIDINDIGLDEDLNNYNENINNLDMGINQASQYQSDLNNIPEYNTEEGTMEDNYGYNDDSQQTQYNPDYSMNDQQTIETLYDDNLQNQIPGDAINQSFAQNNVQGNYPPPPKAKKKSSPLLLIILIALLGTFGYLKKDLIMEQVNNLIPKKDTQIEDVNMPKEGDIDKLDNNQNQDMEPELKKEIGDIPGENGGPQDKVSMDASLKQKNSDYNSIETLKQKSPEPLNSNSIKKLYWEIPQELTYNDAVVNYLKTIGKAMKFDMQSNLLNVHDMPYSNKMIIDIKMNKSGEVQGTDITVSSGSKQIDTIVLQSVKAALKYVKAPTAEFQKESYDFSLIINF